MLESEKSVSYQPDNDRKRPCGQDDSDETRGCMKRKFSARGEPNDIRPAAVKRPEKEFKSQLVINASAIMFFGKYAERRAPQRMFAFKHNLKWYGFNADNPDKAKLLDGRFAYVTHAKRIATERAYPYRTVVWSIPNGVHNTTFHVGLSDFAEVVAGAGEVSFGQGMLQEWDKGSGNYSPTDAVKNNTEFDPNKYVPLTYKP